MNLAALVGATDAGSTRLVYAMVIGLAVIGFAFIGLGIWLVRRTKVDPEVLAPLERMGDAAWKKRDPATQRRLLDEVRPPGAIPLRTGPAAPTIYREFDNRAQRPVASLSDLGPGVVPTKDPTPAGAPAPLDPDPDRVESDAVEPDAIEPDAAETDAESTAEAPDVVEPDVESTAGAPDPLESDREAMAEASDLMEPDAESTAEAPDLMEPDAESTAGAPDPLGADEPASETAG